MKNIITFEGFLNESINTNIDNLTIDELFTEAVKRSSSEVIKAAEDKIKEQISRYSKLMKSNPEKADLYKAQLDLIHAKESVLAMKKKLDLVKSSMVKL